jgi:hypothetical protein
MFQTKVVEQFKTHFQFSNFFQIVCRLLDNAEKHCRDGQATDLTIWCKRVACCIIKAKNTHSEYVVLTAFLTQQWLYKCALLLRYTYITCLVRF